MQRWDTERRLGVGSIGYFAVVCFKSDKMDDAGPRWWHCSKMCATLFEVVVRELICMFPFQRSKLVSYEYDTAKRRFKTSQHTLSERQSHCTIRKFQRISAVQFRLADPRGRNRGPAFRSAYAIGGILKPSVVHLFLRRNHLAGASLWS